MANLKKSKTSVNVGKYFLDVYIYEKDIYFKEDNTPQGIQKILSGYLIIT